MKPILFNDDDVRAILDGRKTQTRRAFPKNYAQYEIDAPRGPEDYEAGYPFICDNDDCFSAVEYCPFGRPGDRLWVREAWSIDDYSSWDSQGSSGAECALIYRADGAERQLTYLGPSDSDPYVKLYDSQRGDWRPSIHMPRWASRITLEITDIRCQRLQDISEEDAIAEGVVCPRLGTYGMNPETVFRDLWDSIAKPGTLWRDNPWVWAISFKRVEV